MFIYCFIFDESLTLNIFGVIISDCILSDRMIFSNMALMEHWNINQKWVTQVFASLQDFCQ